ncbi:MAG: hypothetical protein K2J57_04400, partial [Bacteroidales bacterium]|nr:hypothetical protein [Bacteroidales bacterium]
MATGRQDSLLLQERKPDLEFGRFGIQHHFRRGIAGRRLRIHRLHGQNDPRGEFYTQDLKEHGITPHFTYSNIPTGTAITLMSPDAERTFATFLGAASTLGAQDLPPDRLEGYGYLHIEGYLDQNYEL